MYDRTVAIPTQAGQRETFISHPEDGGPSNQRFVADSIRGYGRIPGSYAAALYTNGQVAEAALEQTGRRTDDKEALIEAMRSVSLTDTPRGPFHFDRFGNVVSDLFIRRCEKKDGNSSTRRSRPIRPSASSGPTTRNGFFRNRSIPAITHR